jgi:microcystin-dependent protein
MASPIPYSYRQYAGNGTVKDFAVPFPYIERAHVHVYLGFDLLDGTFTSELAETSGYTWTSGTIIRTVVAPATGTTLTVIRQTPSGQQLIEWVDGSNLIAADLNTSDLQNLYVVQEQQDRNYTVVILAGDSDADSAEALAKANQALAESGPALTQSTTALSQSTTALSNSSTALSQSTTALSQSTTALSTANTANANASTAVTTANSANAKADAAISAVANSVNYTAIPNVAGIPATPANNTYIEIADSTGLQSFTPLAGMLVGFVGDAGLSVRLRYTSSPATWNWINYYASNSDARYLKLAGGGLTGPLLLAGPPTAPLNPASKAYTDAADATLTTAAANAQSTATAAQTTANTANATANTASTTANAALPKAGGTMTGNIVFAGGQATATTTAAGIVQLTDATNSASTTTAATAASVKAVQDFAQVVSTTATGAMPKTGGTFTGDVTFGTTAATLLPAGTTAQRPTGAAGMIRFNSTLGGFEGYSGTSWGTIGGGTEPNNGIPAGSIIHVCTTAAPTGWLKANGAAVSRTVYANLFTAIGTAFGAGDGSTTFNLPDLRGEFVRGWADGKAVDTGRTFGSFQDQAFLSHAHTGQTTSTGEHNHNLRIGVRGAVGGDNGLATAQADADEYNNRANVVNGEGSHGHSIVINANGGAETRPRNIALLACIKH